jgi:hypothetical protein
MPSDSVPLSGSDSERVTNSVQRLAAVATDLNKASDELSRAISSIDLVLQGLNLGVPTWVQIKGYEDQYDGVEYWRRELGYARVGKKWGVALRTREGNYNWPDQEACEEWLFNEAPRWLRIEGVEKIPELLEALISSAESTTQKIKGKTKEAKNFASTIAEAAQQASAKGRK